MTAGLVRRAARFVTANPVSRWIWRDDALLVVRAGPEAVRDQVPRTEVKINCWDHVELFEQTERWLTKDAFIRMARSRFDAGTYFFSIVDEGVLACSTWMQPHRDHVHFTEVDQGIDFPPRSAAGFNAYANPRFRGRGHYHSCRIASLRWAFEQNGNEHVFAAIDPKNTVSLHVNTKVGFQPYALLTREIRFGRERKTAELITP